MRGVFLGLGSNLGERRNNLRQAGELLEKRVGKILKQSSIIASKPWGVTGQPDFLNMVVKVETELPPVELLRECQKIEKDLGRERAEKWGPRTIDIDILLYGNWRIDEEDLKIPHPLMGEREFVLNPLFEIAPELKKHYL